MSKRKIRVTRENNVLYHFTSVYHAIAIVDSGYLKLTESNLVSPDGTWQTELKSKNYKPVVWLTDSEVPEGLGLSSCPMKKRVRITVAKTGYHDILESLGSHRSIWTSGGEKCFAKARTRPVGMCRKKLYHFQIS